MKTCTDCGLPAPSTTLACALCAHPFLEQGPASYRLERHQGSYRWSLDGEEVVSAVGHEGMWDLIDSDSGKVAVTLIGTAEGNGSRVAMVDHRHRAVATFIPAQNDSAGLGLVRDSHDHVMMAVRADGPTGVHLVDNEGKVLALASRHRPSLRGLDLLVTRAGALRNETIVFAVSLSLELMRHKELVPRTARSQEARS